MPHPERLGKIAIIPDGRLSRARRAILTRIANSLRTFAEVTVLAENTEEDALLKQLKTEPFDLVLAPWHGYLKWRRTEGFFGLSRTSGPTFAGYFCDPVTPDELGPLPDHYRAIVLDFCHLGLRDISLLVKNLLVETRRTGIFPFLKPTAPIYFEHWYQSQGLGTRIDSLFALPEIAKHGWNPRAHAIRTCLIALWSLIYEEGPGKSDLRQAISGNSPVASLQIGIDDRMFLLRLCFQLPSRTPRSLLEKFWPRHKELGEAAGYLLTYSDFVRAVMLNNSSDVEIVVGLFHGANERSKPSIRTLWVEPVAANLVSEMPFDDHPRMKLLPSATGTLPLAGALDLNHEASGRAKDRHIVEAVSKIRELRKLVDERDQMIRELRAGGVGATAPTALPDAEALIDAFQQRYFEARFQLRQFEVQIEKLARDGATEAEIERLRGHMAVLASREQTWIQSIARTIAHYRQAHLKKKA